MKSSSFCPAFCAGALAASILSAETLILTPIDGQVSTFDGTEYVLWPNNYEIETSRSTSFPNDQRRGVLEFPLSALPQGAIINTAVLDFTVTGYNHSPTLKPKLEFHGYSGNGILSVSDGLQPFNLIGLSPEINGLTGFQADLNPGYIQSLNGTASHLGVMTYAHVIDRFTQISTTELEANNGTPGPKLTIDYTLAPPVTEYYVSHGFFSTDIHGYSSSGQISNTIALPDPGNPANILGRGIVRGENNRLHLINGGEQASLSTLNLSTNTWTHQTLPGFGHAQNIAAGNVAAFGDYVFANDLGDATNPRGIIRFNLATNTAERFAEVSGQFTNVFNVSRGLDGLLYSLVLFDGTTVDHIKAYQPNSLALVKDIEIDWDLFASSVAVDADGNLFVTSEGSILKLNSQGELIDSLEIGDVSVSDIEIAEDGRIIAGGWSHDAYLTDVSLDSFTSFSVGSATSMFVAFADSIVTTPGDTDFDNDVDLTDLATLASQYGQAGGMGWHNGDFDHDGDVDLNDLSTLAASYGAGEAQAFADFQSLASVPEPAAAALVLLLSVPFVRRMRSPQ